MPCLHSLFLHLYNLKTFIHAILQMRHLSLAVVAVTEIVIAVVIVTMTDMNDEEVDSPSGTILAIPEILAETRTIAEEGKNMAHYNHI